MESAVNIETLEGRTQFWAYITNPEEPSLCIWFVIYFTLRARNLIFFLHVAIGYSIVPGLPSLGLLTLTGALPACRAPVTYSPSAEGSVSSAASNSASLDYQTCLQHNCMMQCISRMYKYVWIANIKINTSHLLNICYMFHKLFTVMFGKPLMYLYEVK